MAIFEVEDKGIQGVGLVVIRTPICSLCRSDGEVDYQINRMKSDLDARAKEMKAKIRENAQKPLGLVIGDA